ncbi:MAG: ion transporter [Alphaproteobacteria bacterium]|nr:ion transporter [Alphaproteobacteria bacterium]MBQ9236185.1 ion transporter [Alphaproteobacteria bacterium]
MTDKKTATTGKKKLNKLYYNDNQRRLVTLLGSKGFDRFIMLIILADAVLQGLMTSPTMTFYYDNVMYLLDRMFMGIFISEIFLKMVTWRKEFFRSNWNIFDLVVVGVSSLPLMSIFIVLRTFRLLRLIKYENRNDKVGMVVEVFLRMMPVFAAYMAVFAVFFYIFAIMAVNMFGDTFVVFGSLGEATFSLLQVFTLDGWASTIARPVMVVYPMAWAFFSVFLLMTFLLTLSFAVVVLKLELKR